MISRARFSLYPRPHASGEFGPDVLDNRAQLYLADSNIFPNGLTEGPLQPHYVDSDARAAMERSGELDSHLVSNTFDAS